jgi:hypothetical protein
MTITVYWSSLDKEWIRATDPEPISRIFFNKKRSDIRNVLNNTAQCPAIKDAFHNIFALRSIYDYEFSIRDNSVVSESYNQDFFDSHVVVRDMEQRFFSFLQKRIFFTDSESLKMTPYIHPFMEDNDVARATFSIPGTIDIGKWFRSTEFPFFLRDGFDSFKINLNDVYTYVKFDTQEKIVFKRFIPTEKILFYAESASTSSDFISHGKNTLSNYYGMLKFKKNILKEIKNNLAE